MIILGIVGNIVSFITWRTGNYCKNCPGATYLTALAFSDTCVLCTAGMKYAIQLLFAINLWDLNEVSCRVFHTTWHFFFLISTWIVVSLTIERTMAVCRPLRAAIWNRKKQEMIVVLVLSIVSLALNLPFTVGAKMMPAGEATQDTKVINVTQFQGQINGTLVASTETNSSPSTAVRMVCRADPNSFYYKYENGFHNWFIDFVLLFSAPVGILTLCNAIILGILCRRRYNAVLRELQLPGGKDAGVSGVLTIRVMLLSLVQCISVGPFSIAALIPGVLPEVKAVDTVFVDRILTVLVLVWYLNNCVNFILYSLFGRSFRQDCYYLFRRLFSSRQQFSTISNSDPGKALPSSELDLVGDKSLSTNNETMDTNTSIFV